MRTGIFFFVSGLPLNKEVRAVLAYMLSFVRVDSSGTISEEEAYEYGF